MMSGISIYEHARIFTTKLFVYQNHMKHMKPFTQKWMITSLHGYYGTFRNKGIIKFSVT